MELGLSFAINYNVLLKIGLFKTILGPINMKVWFGGVGDEILFQNICLLYTSDAADEE